MMMNRQAQCPCIRRNTRGEAGFSLVEFLISSTILVVLGASVFSAITDIGRTASYQTEVQTVLQNTRVGMDTIARRIKQAGNNPLSAAFEGITIGGAHQVQIRSDLTGSAPGQPNKGDPDGDTNDLDENVTFRYDANGRAIEMVLGDGTVCRIANYISAFSMQYFDATGSATAVGANVRRIRVAISGATTLANPKTGQTYGITLTEDIDVSTRK
jgi:type II secretory pathway pseudopilin PulG